MNITRLHNLSVLGLAALLTLSACGKDDGDGDAGADPFAPEVAITVGDVEAAASDDGNESVGTVDTAQLTLSSNTLAFDQVAIGTTDVRTLKVLNTGEGNLRIDALALAEDDSDDTREFLPVDENSETTTYFQALQDGKKIYIAPGEGIDLEFQWKPLNTTPDSATLTLETNDPNQTSVEVSLTTPELGPGIETQTLINFPRVAAGSEASRLSFIQNVGQSPLQIKDIVLSPASTTDFSVTFPSKDNPDDPEQDSDTWQSTIAPGEDIPIRVTFTPDSDAPANASVFISSNDPDKPQAEIKLEGNAGTPCIKLGGVVAVENPSEDETHTLEFGESQIGRATTKTVTIENCSRTQDLEVSDITMSNDGGGVFEIGATPEGLADGVATIAPLESATFEVNYTPTGEETNDGRVVLSSNDEVNRELRIDVSGKGTNNVCPVAVAEASIVGSSGRPSTMLSTIPLKTIQFTGVNSRDPDGEVGGYEWRIISKPTNSTARLTPNNRVSDPKLFLDLAGEYVVELVVYDAIGQKSCEAAKVYIQATPDEDIHVQLVWDTPSDTNQDDTFGTDLDLHYLNPRGRWDVEPYDIFWRNPTADWGVPGDNSDDPSLDIDDTDGAGPENVNHDNPKSGTSYGVGVYYYNDNGFGPSYATIRIYIEGTLKYESRDKYMQKEDVFWEVGTIVWPSKQIFARDLIHQGFPQ